MKFIKGLYKTLKFQDYFYLIFTHEFKGEKNNIPSISIIFHKYKLFNNINI